MNVLASAVPDLKTLAAYSLACFVLFVTPGPDMSLFLARTMAAGRRAGLAAMLGAMVGCCIHTSLAALGLSALIAASATAFAALKIVGAVYLLWLAFDALRNGSALRLREGPRAPASFQRDFLLGLGINLTNPKIVLFFVTFLPQFVDPSDPDAASKLVFLGLYFVLFTSPFAALLVVGAERALVLLTGRPRLMRAVDYVFAGVFAAFAIRIAAAETR
jgi:threonine/homoserine/homoserine lactone efflux protein